MKKRLLNLLTLLLIMIFLFSLYQVGSYYYASYQYKKSNAQLIEKIDHGEEGEETREKPFEIKYAHLIQENSDFIGWISIEDTQLNYPVMYTPHDPEYYLRRGFDREYEFRGTIFVGANTDLNKPSDNVILYGHNMDDLTMFGALRAYKDESYFKEHPIIRFETQAGSFDYEIFSVFRTVDDPKHPLYIDYYKFIDAIDEAQYQEYVAEFVSRSYYNTGIVPQYGEQLLTLSTCEYSEENGRLVVVARKIAK